MSEWIPIKKQLPPFMDMVILHTDEGVTVGWLETQPPEDPDFAAGDPGFYFERVTHWMELPKPPNQ